MIRKWNAKTEKDRSTASPDIHSAEIAYEEVRKEGNKGLGLKTEIRRLRELEG